MSCPASGLPTQVTLATRSSAAAFVAAVPKAAAVAVVDGATAAVVPRAAAAVEGELGHLGEQQHVVAKWCHDAGGA